MTPKRLDTYLCVCLRACRTYARAQIWITSLNRNMNRWLVYPDANTDCGRGYPTRDVLFAGTTNDGNFSRVWNPKSIVSKPDFVLRGIDENRTESCRIHWPCEFPHRHALRKSMHQCDSQSYWLDIIRECEIIILVAWTLLYQIQVIKKLPFIPNES